MPRSPMTCDVYEFLYLCVCFELESCFILRIFFKKRLSLERILIEKSRKIATQLTGKAFEALKTFKGKAAALEALAEYLLKRNK